MMTFGKTLLVIYIIINLIIILYFKVPEVSYDMIENDRDPSSNFPWHGTSCAGIIGAGKNRFCGMGIAYEVNLGGNMYILLVCRPPSYMPTIKCVCKHTLTHL